MMKKRLRKRPSNEATEEEVKSTTDKISAQYGVQETQTKGRIRFSKCTGKKPVYTSGRRFQ
jgi:hypothetical protein